VLVGEAPVGGADPDSGMVGDIVERDLQPVLGEQLTTGDQQPLAIAGGVLAKFRFLHSAILASGYHPSEYLPVSGSLSDGDHAEPQGPGPAVLRVGSPAQRRRLQSLGAVSTGSTTSAGWSC